MFKSLWSCLELNLLGDSLCAVYFSVWLWRMPGVVDGPVSTRGAKEKEAPG